MGNRLWAPDRGSGAAPGPRPAGEGEVARVPGYARAALLGEAEAVGTMGCKHRAILIVTRGVRGTASNIAKRRIDLQCTEPEGHEGPHRDAGRGEQWRDRGDMVTHILRDESEL